MSFLVPLDSDFSYHWFQGELHVSKLFSHPNILPYRATFIADNELWVVTPFMAYGEWERAPAEGDSNNLLPAGLRAVFFLCYPFLLPHNSVLQVLQRISSVLTSWMA